MRNLFSKPAGHVEFFSQESVVQKIQSELVAAKQQIEKMKKEAAITKKHLDFMS